MSVMRAPALQNVLLRLLLIVGPVFAAAAADDWPSCKSGDSDRGSKLNK
jgi:hypothetical protein